MNYDSQSDVKKLLSDAQTAEEDNRERAREVNHFLEKDDGQWEPEIISNMSGRPRYTFDKCNPIVDSIAGEMEQADFTIKLRPASNNANKADADIIAGLIRNIESMSDAEDIYNRASRKMVKCGFDAWMIKQDWVDGDSFEQDLLIKRISNAIDRVWFDENSEEPDASDAMHSFLLHTMVKDRYMEKYPDSACQSINNSVNNQVYYYKPNFVVFAQIFYKEMVEKQLVLMSNGDVHEVNEDFERVRDELYTKNITVINERVRKSHVVYTRFFDGADWLNEAQETVFTDYTPIIPIYGNFDVSEDKIIYRGAINKLMDAQRVYNYAESRSIEEGALAPREKHWMTPEQASGHEASIRTFNTNADPVQLYNHVIDQPQPYKTGGPQVNMGLQQTAANMGQNIIEGSGVFAANQGNAPNQSGVAIELQQNKGDNSTIKYFSAREKAITHTARILIRAIPKVYDTPRTVRILGEDGTSKMMEVNKQIMDDQTQQLVTLHDLRAGKYDVVCDVGPAFKNRQQETARAFIDIANIDPTIIQQGKDIWLSNLNVPGMDDMAERARKQLLEAGMIPDSQMTDEEKQRAMQMIEQARQEAAQQQNDPMAELMLAQLQNEQQDTQSRISERLGKLNLLQRKQELEEMKFSQQAQNQANQLIMQQNMSIVDELKKQAETLKIIREAMGATAIIGPDPAQAYKQQTEIVSETQAEQA